VVGDHNPNPDFNCTWIGVWRYPSDRNCRNTNLMPMTHVPEIGTEYRYQKTGTISRHENRALSYLLPKTSTRKIWYQIACQMLQNLLPVFWYRFLAPISGTCFIGVMLMTHIVEKSSLKTNTSFWHIWHAVWYQIFLVPDTTSFP